MQQVIYKLDKERTLRLSFKAISRLEKALGTNALSWNFLAFTFEQIASTLAEAMRSETQDITADLVMELIDEFSDAKTAYKKFNELIGATFGKNETPATEEKQTTPPEGQETPTVLN